MPIMGVFFTMKIGEAVKIVKEAYPYEGTEVGRWWKTMLYFYTKAKASDEISPELLFVLRNEIKGVASIIQTEWEYVTYESDLHKNHLKALEILEGVDGVDHGILADMHFVNNKLKRENYTELKKKKLTRVKKKV